MISMNRNFFDTCENCRVPLSSHLKILKLMRTTKYIEFEESSLSNYFNIQVSLQFFQAHYQQVHFYISRL